MPPPPSIETKNPADIEQKQMWTGAADAEASGMAGAAAGGDDPYAYASLRNVAHSSADNGQIPPIVGAIIRSFERESSGPGGAATIAVHLDGDGRVSDARYASGAIGSVRGAKLAAHFIGCPIGGLAGEHVFVVQLPFDMDQPPPNNLTIDERGCHT